MKLNELITALIELRNAHPEVSDNEVYVYNEYESLHSEETATIVDVEMAMETIYINI